MTVPEWVRDSVREETGEETEILNVKVLRDSPFGKMAAVQTEDRGFIVENKVFGRSNTFSVEFLGPGSGPVGETGTGLPEVETTMDPEPAAREAGQPTAQTPTDPQSGRPIASTEAPTETGRPAAGGDGEPVTAVEGIGETYESYLADIGIRTLSDLTAADTERIAEHLGLSPKIVSRWQAQVELTSLTGIGPQYAELLARTGLTTISDLAEADPAAVLKEVNAKQGKLDVSIQGNVIGPKRVAAWIQTAREHIGMDGTVEIPEPMETGDALTDDLTTITGIGNTRSDQLAEHGITTVTQLAEADAETLAEALGVGVATVEGWQAQADLTTIDGIGPRRAEGLREHGIVVTGQLADADTEEVAEALGVSTDQVETWKRSANGSDGN